MATKSHNMVNRVSVLNGHKIIMLVECQEATNLDKIKAHLQSKEFIRVLEDPRRPQLRIDREFNMKVSIGRFQFKRPNKLSFCIVTHNTQYYESNTVFKTETPEVLDTVLGAAGSSQSKEFIRVLEDPRRPQLRIDREFNMKVSIGRFQFKRPKKFHMLTSKNENAENMLLLPVNTSSTQKDDRSYSILPVAIPNSSLKPHLIKDDNDSQLIHLNHQNNVQISTNTLSTTALAQQSVPTISLPVDTIISTTSTNKKSRGPKRRKLDKNHSSDTTTTQFISVDLVIWNINGIGQLNKIKLHTNGSPKVVASIRRQNKLDTNKPAAKEDKLQLLKKWNELGLHDRIILHDSKHKDSLKVRKRTEVLTDSSTSNQVGGTIVLTNPLSKSKYPIILQNKWFTITELHRSTVLLSLYLAPSLKSNLPELELQFDTLFKAVVDYDNIIVAGDFNIHFNEKNPLKSPGDRLVDSFLDLLDLELVEYNDSLFEYTHSRPERKSYG